MARWLQEVHLGNVSLDMESLVQYDGRGECGEVWLYGDIINSVEDKMKVWARNIGWTMSGRG